MIKNKIDKIIITGQMLREYNIMPSMWIYSLFAQTIEEVTGLPVYCTTVPWTKYAQKNKFIEIDIKKIYDAYNIPFEYDYLRKDINLVNDAWSKIYYRTEYNEKAYRYVYDIFKNSIVISHEVEDCLSKMFDYYNIPQIDNNLDPVRFLDDVMLCFKSNNKNVYRQLLKYRVDEDYIKLSANYIKTGNNFNQFKPCCEKLESKVLFLGQTDCDKTIIDSKTGKVYSILEHKEEFKKALEGYDKILYKRHPYAKNDEKIIEFINSIGNIEITNKNFYKLMSDDNIKKVVSISSGTCSEARYFGKDVQLLLKEGVPRQTEDKFDAKKYVSIYQDYFSMNFWSDILRPLVKTKKYDKLVSIAGTKNKLRNTRSNDIYYAYEDFEQFKVKSDIKKSDFISDIIRKFSILIELEENDEIIS